MFSLWFTRLFSDVVFVLFFFFKQKTAYEMRISDWSSDVCSSDLYPVTLAGLHTHVNPVRVRPSTFGRGFPMHHQAVIGNVVANGKHRVIATPMYAQRRTHPHFFVFHPR